MTIAWLDPAALPLLAAAAVPIVIHWLLRRRADRRRFPSVRFLTPNDQSSVRLFRPSDLLLLILRVAIVACAALAMAHPLWLSEARRRAWETRTTRAIVVDTSASVNGARATEAAEAESRAVTASKRFDTPTPRDMLVRASAWLQRAEPGRREVVIVSDFQRGVIAASDVASVPWDIGIRPVRIESEAEDSVSLDADVVLYGGESYSRSVVADAESTTVTLERLGRTPGLETVVGQGFAERVSRAVTEAGVIAPSQSQPVVVRFGGTGGSGVRVLDGWMRDAGLRLLSSPTPAGARVEVLAEGQAMVVRTDAPADSLLAATITQAALNARQDPDAWADREPGRVHPSLLAAWTRPSAPPQLNAWRNSTQSDGRWLWLAAVALLGIEGLVRRHQRQSAAHVEAHAA